MLKTRKSKEWTWENIPCQSPFQWCCICILGKCMEIILTWKVSFINSENFWKKIHTDYPSCFADQRGGYNGETWSGMRQCNFHFLIQHVLPQSHFYQCGKTAKKILFVICFLLFVALKFLSSFTKGVTFLEGNFFTSSLFLANNSNSFWCVQFFFLSFSLHFVKIWLFLDFWEV